MKLYRLVLPILAGLLMAAGTLVAFARATPAPASPTAPLVLETDLIDASGAEGTNGAENMHADAQGRLWISQDADGAAYVRVFDPATHVYTDYTGLVSPNDAQLGPNDNVWWSLDDPILGLARLNLASRTVTTWTVPGFSAASLAFDSNNHVWGLDSGGSPATVFSFTAATRQLCTASLPNGNGNGATLVEQNGALWAALDDAIKPGLARITPTTNAYTFWPVNVNGFSDTPVRLSFAPGGEIWFADEISGTIGRLDTATNRVILYNPPGGNFPQSVEYFLGQVWFTTQAESDSGGGAIGVLNPATAAGTTPTVVTPTTAALSPVCVDAGPGLTFTAGMRTGVSVFRGLALTTTTDAQGIAYGTPISSQPAALVRFGSNLWMTDQGRNTLVNFVITPTNLYLPLVRR